MRPIDADRMKEELLWGNAFLSAKEINALVDLIDNQPTLTPPNEPLTPDELLTMDGEPVYIPKLKSWGLVNIEEELIYKNTGWAVKLYESLLLGVYRRPPERQEDTR